MHKRILIGFLAVACLGAVITATASANSRNNTVSGWNVTQSLTLYYNQQSCQGTTAYQIYETVSSWTRPDLNKSIGPAVYNAGEVVGNDCSLNSVQKNDNLTWSTISWGCPDQFHSCSSNNTRTYSWPYILMAYNGEGTVAGANLKGTVYDRNLGQLGSLCSTVYVIGNGSC